MLVLAAAAVVLAAVSGGVGFAAGRASAPTDAVVAAAPATAAPTSAAAPTPRVTADPPATGAATVPAPGSRTGNHPGSYVYTVESNYEVMLTYTDSNGDQISVSSVAAPWSLTVDTAEWGADARPTLIASSGSTKGDTTVSCTITDDTGQVVANERKEAAFAGAVCSVYY